MISWTQCVPTPWIWWWKRSYSTILVTTPHMFVLSKRIKWVRWGHTTSNKRKLHTSGSMLLCFSMEFIVMTLVRFIASASTYANLMKQVKLKQKIIDKMEAAGLIEKINPSTAALSLWGHSQTPTSHYCIQWGCFLLLRQVEPKISLLGTGSVSQHAHSHSNSLFWPHMLDSFGDITFVSYTSAPVYVPSCSYGLRLSKSHHWGQVHCLGILYIWHYIS